MFGSGGRLRKRLQREGREAPAVVVRAQPTTTTLGYGGIATDVRWKLKLRVAGEWDVDVADFFPVATPPNEGSTLKVLYDPADRSKVCAVRDSVVPAPAPPSATPPRGLRETQLARAREGQANLYAGRVIDLRPQGVQQLERLAALHGQGALTDAEFAEAKRRLDGA
jgi:hypothetical protein